MGLVLDRLDFYYLKVKGIQTQLSKNDEQSRQDFQKAMKKNENEFGIRLANTFEDKTWMAEIYNAVKSDRPLGGFFSPTGFYKQKKNIVWLVFAAAMIPYVGFGIWSTDNFTEIHTNLAKAAFTLFMLLCFLLTHLQWRHINRVLRGFASLSLLGSIAGGIGYSIWNDYWWEYILVACLHANMFTLCFFHAYIPLEFFAHVKVDLTENFDIDLPLRL